MFHLDIDTSESSDISNSGSSPIDVCINTMLHESLGKFYFESHMNCPPTFLQIVGWTKSAPKVGAKRIHVYVRKVPLIINNSPNGGFWYFDNDIINKYAEEIQEPVYNPKSPLVTGNAIIIPGGQYLRYNGITVPLHIIENKRPSKITIS